MCLVRSGADYSFKEPKEPLSAPVLSPADTRSSSSSSSSAHPVTLDHANRTPLLGQLVVSSSLANSNFLSLPLLFLSIDRFKKEAVAKRGYDDGSVEIVEGVPL